MKEQFTQGEWGFQANDSYIELHAGGKMIGDLCMGLNTCTEAELKANAQLFKVAPKMYRELQLLKMFVHSIEESIPNDGLGLAQAASSIEYLLAEARGEK